VLFLYGELLVLLLVSFGIGSAVAALVVRLLVKELPADLAYYEVRRDASSGGGTP